MANRRMITSDTFEDEFFISLDLFGRVLWMGLIVKCADDQGRMQDNPILIKSQVFPADDYSPEQIEKLLSQFAEAERIIRFSADGKKIIQIANWWKHQTPQWASKSRYPSPPGWADREKYHAPGNKIVTKNWNMPGGYVTNPVTNLVTNPVGNPPSNLVESGLNEINGEIKGEDEGEGTPPPTPPPPNIFTVFEQELGMMLTPAISEELLLAEKEYPEGWVVDALKEASKYNRRSWAYAHTILKNWKAKGRGNGERAQPEPYKPVFAEEY